MLSAALCASFKDVEHSCQQCGNTVEDGRPFCPQCRAPQISVKIAIPDAENAHDLSSHPDQLPYDTSVETRLASPDARHAVPGTMDRAIAARSAIKAGVLGFFLGMFLPFIAVVLAGALAVYFYRRESGVVPLTAIGSRLGGAAGVVATAIQSIYFVVWIFAFHRQKEYIDSMTRVLHSAGADSWIPYMQDSVRVLFTPGGLAFTLIFVMIFALALSAVGGALASLWMRSRGPQS